MADGDLEVDPESLNTDKPLSKAKIDLIEGSFRAAWSYDPNHSGRHQQTGMNVQYVCGPSGRADFVSEAMTGRTHDSEAAEAAGLDVAFADLDIPVLSDLAYVSISGWETPVKKCKGRDLTEDQRECNKNFSGLRFAVERAIGCEKGHCRILRYNSGTPSETGRVALSRFLRGYDQPPLRHAVR